MREIFNILSAIIYILVGIICLVMAVKCISARKFLPFHEEAAGKSWDSIEKPLQIVILTILKISGLGFLVIFLFLFFLSVYNYFAPDHLIKYLIPIISSIYCFGLFLFNYRLFRQTNARTPWKGSIIAMFMILTGFLLSVVGKSL